MMITTLGIALVKDVFLVYGESAALMKTMSNISSSIYTGYEHVVISSTKQAHLNSALSTI
jgi:hypothetical protein